MSTMEVALSLSKSEKEVESVHVLEHAVSMMKRLAQGRECLHFRLEKARNKNVAGKCLISGGVMSFRSNDCHPDASLADGLIVNTEPQRVASVLLVCQRLQKTSHLHHPNNIKTGVGECFICLAGSFLVGAWLL